MLKEYLESIKDLTTEKNTTILKIFTKKQKEQKIMNW